MLARALGRRFVFVSALEHIGASFEPKRATKGVKPKRKLRILEDRGRQNASLKFAGPGHRSIGCCCNPTGGISANRRSRTPFRLGPRRRK